MMKNYWFISESADGCRNLAMDEWFLNNIDSEDIILYFYINKNAVIIGKNQNPWKECNLSAMDSNHVQLVRRITGGGAVYHDNGNLNFSFIAGEKRYDLEKQLQLILQAVSSFGIQCEFSGRNDLLANGKKFSGNAFCGNGKNRMHHGTLLINSDLDNLQNYLNVDPKKINSKGIDSVKSRVCNLSDLSPSISTKTMISSLIKEYGKMYGKVDEYVFVNECKVQLEKYYEKHTSWEWQMGNTMPFDIELEHRFVWGGVQMLFSLKKAVIENIQVYSDAIDTELTFEISSRLKGCRFNSKDMHEALFVSEKENVREVARYILMQKL